MNVKYLYSLILVIALFLIAYAGVEVVELQWVFGVIVPYAAVAIFLWGFVSKILGWANSAVPFRIPTTAGQQKSFDWIRQNKIDNPSTTGGVFVRMALEILVFRSLFRNTKMALHKGAKLIYFKTDIVAAKELAMGLVTFKPCIPETVGSIFYIHLFLVSTLLAYFPYSKLMHSGGVFLSPTRNQANNTRMQRHVNPWNYPVKTHTYEEYEDDFREKMIEAGLPVDKE